MQNPVPAAFGERRLDRAGIRQIGHNQPHAFRQRRTVALTQVVEHDDLVPAFEERENDMAADKSGAARDEKPHEYLS